MKRNQLRTNQKDYAISLMLKVFKVITLVFVGCIVYSVPALAQASGVSAGMTSLTTEAGTIKSTGKTILYSLAVIMLLIGAVRVMSKVGGEREGLHKEIAGWLGAAIFFAVAALVVDKFVPA